MHEDYGKAQYQKQNETEDRLTQEMNSMKYDYEKKVQEAIMEAQDTNQKLIKNEINYQDLKKVKENLVLENEYLTKLISDNDQ